MEGILAQNHASKRVKNLSPQPSGTRHNDRQFPERFEVAGIEGVNPVNVVPLHGRYDLQIDNLSTCDRAAPEPSTLLLCAVASLLPLTKRSPNWRRGYARHG